MLPIKAIRNCEEMMRHLGPSEPFKVNRRRMYWLLRLLSDGFQSFVFRHVVRKVEDELYRLSRRFSRGRAELNISRPQLTDQPAREGVCRKRPGSNRIAKAAAQDCV